MNIFQIIYLLLALGFCVWYGTIIGIDLTISHINIILSVKDYDVLFYRDKFRIKYSICKK